MYIPLQRTLIHLAVAGTCGILALPGQAEETQAGTNAGDETPAAPAPESAPAPAPPPAATSAANTVVVSGSRIAARGFTQPTPTTSLTSADFDKAAKPNMFESLVELPALQGSTGRTTNTFSTSSGIQGLSSLSLRGLGTIRTLTLLDGQRVVGANVTGVTDVSQFPQLLVKRVDVVTGGASASYGSDAIGGVVNFITDKKFTGFKANVAGGMTRYHDDKSGTLQAAWGKGFLDDRLHVTVSGEFTKQNGIDSPGFGEVGPNGRTWYDNPALQESTKAMQAAGAPRYKYIHHAQHIQYAKYGLITDGPLRGTAFGPGGTPYPFEYGTDCVGNFCIGGDRAGSVGAGTNLAMNFKRQVAYSRVSWNLDADNEIYVTGNWAQVKSVFSPNPGAAKQGNLAIRCDNAFLPASVAAGCATGYPSGVMSVGTSNGEFPANINVHPTRTQRRFVVGADGRFALFGKDWTYDAYAEHGENTTVIHVRDITLNRRYNFAIDAVRDPVSGQVVCRSAEARAAGCRPINIFGDVPIDMAGWQYIAPANGPVQHTDSSQNVASININGELAEGWAGPISMAFGAEYRREKYAVHGDPYGAGVAYESPYSDSYPLDPTLSATGDNWFAGNYHNGKGSFNVKEAYVEFNIPFLKSATFGEANLNVADRQEKYSTAGHASAWKIGATWKTPVDGLRLRAVSSKDVRAPNLSELYAAMTVTNQAVNNNQGTSVQIQQRNVGNPALKPETARNNSFGVVLSQPGWARNFNLSIDYYDIKVKNVINSLNAQQEVDLCYAGYQDVCAAVSINGPAGTNYVLAQSFNFASLHTRGVDFEMAYRKSLADYNLPGSVTLRGLASRTIHSISDPGVPGTTPSEGAGNMTGSTPKWKALLSQSWDSARFGLTLTERWISAGVINNEYIECQANCPLPTAAHPTIYDNHLPGAVYLDLGGTWNLTKQATAYFKIDNLADRDPVLVPQTNLSLALNPAIYDAVGRTYRAGVRMTF
ncbi:TonB-dependent receptor-like protein [Pseudoduganella flava]|uniref:TonB-dependent receptor n=1 Tax=Pseudoduganella flava TaxID=871742 RepID=A0A562Q0L1_9BURK|nr:TonB-dependent receptor [Pseudoduganella flava]QGZ38243.1 TonB-dependent receptor [Pseudoduganella flava]TWI50225.1 TonB-dependent receptor-like protein [Pseudoduganella flava]